MIRFHILGTPAPQGSKRHVGKGVMVESSKNVGPWRDSVAYAARRGLCAKPLDGPLHIELIFTLPRPKATKQAVSYVSKRPDLDKLIRSTLDGIGMARVWRDDAQVASITAIKRYEFDKEPPGCHVRITKVAP